VDSFQRNNHVVNRFMKKKIITILTQIYFGDDGASSHLIY